MDKVTHFEIPAEDAARANSFYKDVFGWKINKAMPDMEYYMAYTDEVDEKYMPKSVGTINGAIAPKEDTFQAPTIVATVSSIDDTAKKVENAGGSIIMPKREIPKMGFYARIKDTEGNVIGIWEDISKQ